MAEPLLACTVRGCALPLSRADRMLRCDRGHAYDIARSGYVNLLQPQDRKSLEAGDPRDAVAARGRLLDTGIGGALIETVAAAAVSLPIGDLPQVVDLGSGTGHALAAVAGARPIAGAGIDLSTAAAEHAARRYPALTWVVANADRTLPLSDGSTALILSIHGRRNPVECARVLQTGGFLLVAVPAADDLIELRASIQGEGLERNRIDDLIAEHDPLFLVVRRLSARERHRLDPGMLRELLRSTYRGARHQSSSRVDSLETLHVTLASDIVIFTPRA